MAKLVKPAAVSPSNGELSSRSVSSDPNQLAPKTGSGSIEPHQQLSSSVFEAIDTPVSTPVGESSGHVAHAIHAIPQTIHNQPKAGTPQEFFEDTLHEAMHDEVKSHDSAETNIDMEDPDAPDPSQLAPESADSTPSCNEDEEQPSPVSPVGHTDSDIIDGESDNYEPPEATPPLDMSSPVDSPPFSPAPPEPTTETSPDTSPSNVDLSIGLLGAYDEQQNIREDTVPSQSQGATLPVEV